MVKPTESELEILRVLWNSGPSSVRDVNDIINQTKEAGYTTTLKLMQIMAKKGLVERDMSSRTHIYKPMIAEKDVQSAMLDRLLHTAFGGSASELVINALGKGKTSKKELEEIKAIIKKLEEDGK